MFIQECATYLQRHYSIPQYDVGYSQIASSTMWKMCASFKTAVLAGPLSAGVGIFALAVGTLGLVFSPPIGVVRAGFHTIEKLFCSPQESYMGIAKRTWNNMCGSAKGAIFGLNTLALGVSALAIGTFGLLSDPVQGGYRMARHAFRQLAHSTGPLLSNS